MGKTITIIVSKTSWGAVAPALDALDKAGADYAVTATDAAGPVPVPVRTDPKAPAPVKAKPTTKVAPKVAAKPKAPPVPKRTLSTEEIDRVILGRIVNSPGIASKDLHREGDSFSKDQKGRSAQRLVEQGLVDMKGTARGASKFWPTPKGTAAHKPTPPAPKAPEPEETPESLRFRPQGDGTAMRKGRLRKA